MGRPLQAELVREGALAVLRKNDLGSWTKPAPRLYPHQWSWDSAFIAIGLASVDLNRALHELESLFRAQWQDGRVPHIVFNPEARDYFPGPGRWGAAEASPLAPLEPATSGLVQPPIHAIALSILLARLAKRNPSSALLARVNALYPRVLAWHRYLATFRDPEGTGLLSIYHPWESGTDNSPRWDAPFARLEVGEVAPYVRHDLKHVTDPSERPTEAEYDRYLWLVELLKNGHYDDAAAHRDHPFLIKDVLMSGIFAIANVQLARVAEELGRPAEEFGELIAYARRSTKAVLAARDPAQGGLALDWDVRANEPVRVQTCAGLAPLLLPDVPSDILSSTVETAFGPRFAGAPGFRFPVIPSTAPGTPGFQARSYWRGPTWPVMNWLVCWSLQRHGLDDRARQLRTANLGLLSRPEAQFAEYLEPYTGEPLGSIEQSWTAAVVLDWLDRPD
jgi:hypothetical protein